jgi:hypothetical protein
MSGCLKLLEELKPLFEIHAIITTSRYGKDYCRARAGIGRRAAIDVVRSTESVPL